MAENSTDNSAGALKNLVDSLTQAIDSSAVKAAELQEKKALENKVSDIDKRLTVLESSRGSLKFWITTVISLAAAIISGISLIGVFN